MRNTARMLLAIDPGAKTGWALFDRDGVLDSAGTAEFLVCAPQRFLRGAEVVIENPRIYPTTKRPNDILTLARIVGRFEERYRTSEVRLVTPREWKGTLPKALMAKRILAALTPQERVIAKGLGPDAIDAIGLGKWALAHPKW